MIQTVCTPFVLLPLLGLLQGVHSEQIYHVAKRGTLRGTRCNRGVSSSAPEGDDDYLTGSLLQRSRVLPADDPEEEEEDIGESSNKSITKGANQTLQSPVQPKSSHDVRLYGNKSGRTNWFSWPQNLQWFAIPVQMSTMIRGQPPSNVTAVQLNVTAVQLNVTGISSAKLNVTSAVRFASSVGKHLILQLSALVQLSQNALASKGRDLLMASYARGEMPLVMFMFAGFAFAMMAYVFTKLPKNRDQVSMPTQRMNPIPQSACHLPSSSLLRLGPGRVPNSSPRTSHGGPLMMHTGAPSSAAFLHVAQAPSTAPASAVCLSPSRSLHQALNEAAPRLSLPSINEVQQHLCMELVVPPGTECCLHLPVQTFGSRHIIGDGGHVSVNDAQGQVVFDVALVPRFVGARSSWGSLAHEHQNDLDKRLVLRSAVDSYVFGSCKTHASLEPRCGRVALALCNSKDAPFGVLQQDSSGGFMMKALDNWTVKVRDCGQAYKRFEDGDGWLLASVMGSNHSRMARISPQVDAGLIVLMTLGIELISEGLAIE